MFTQTRGGGRPRGGLESGGRGEVDGGRGRGGQWLGAPPAPGTIGGGGQPGTYVASVGGGGGSALSGRPNPQCRAPPKGITYMRTIYKMPTTQYGCGVGFRRPGRLIPSPPWGPTRASSALRKGRVHHSGRGGGLNLWFPVAPSSATPNPWRGPPSFRGLGKPLNPTIPKMDHDTHGPSGERPRTTSEGFGQCPPRALCHVLTLRSPTRPAVYSQNANANAKYPQN